MHISQLLISASQQLDKLSDSARLDAEILLAYALGKSRTWLATWPDKSLPDNEIKSFNSLLKRRKTGEPIAHITGSREFWSLDLKITKDTLIPRPETELMIEKILSLYPQQNNIELLDLGTGSGAIALALASERPDWKITATDQSTSALNIARQNAQRLALKNINFQSGDWFAPLKNRKFDIIASNPPYIPHADPHLSHRDVRFEPRSALASGEDGLDAIRLICEQARTHLKPEAMLIIEHGFDQKSELHNIFMLSGYKNIRQDLDLSANPRLTHGFNL